MLKKKEEMTADKGHPSGRPWKMEVMTDSNGEKVETKQERKVAIKKQTKCPVNHRRALNIEE